MKAIFATFNVMLEAVFFLCYPFIYLYLRKFSYLDAILVKGKSTQGGILFHAASMGEVAAIQPLVLELINRHPKLRICITTSTITGLKQAKAIHPKVQAYLSALDVAHLRYRQLHLLKPALICIVETEIWPNLLAWAKTHAVPVLWLNARMSQRSLSRYALIKPLLRFLEKPLRGIYAQTEADALRYQQLFSQPVRISGNLKYAKQLTDYDTKVLRDSWGYREHDFILAWGSSRPGEEALLLSIWPKLKAEIAQLKLIIAIRHPQRTGEVQKQLAGYNYGVYSGKKTGQDILLIDSLGVLDKAYAISDIVIVGGSFFNFGGHNPLEPAYYAKPIIMGQDYASCKESVAKLLQARAIVVSDASKLSEDVLKLHHNRPLMQQMGAKAKKVLTENAQSLAIQLSAIEKELPFR